MSTPDFLNRPRILMAKPGLDGHDRGIKISARALRDAGMEVIYTGLHQTPEQIVAAAIQEDVQIIGLNIHSGAHMTLIPRIRQLLLENNAGDIIIMAGGTVPDRDRKELIVQGYAQEIFRPGCPVDEVVYFVQQVLAERRSNHG
ncbi:MAG: cobalamin B12-binding domain-containing protein [Thermincolia bacterium]